MTMFSFCSCSAKERKDPRYDGCCHQRSSCIHIVIHLVSLGVIITLVFFLERSKLRSDCIPTVCKKPELCWPCSQLVRGYEWRKEDLIAPFRRKKGDTCCVKSDEIPETIHQIIKKKLSIEKDAGTMCRLDYKVIHHCINRTTVTGAHMIGTMPQKRNETEKYERYHRYLIKNWEHERDNTFLANVKYHHGRLIIPSDGLYYVYTQVYFVEVKPASDDDDNWYSSKDTGDASHYLYRYNKNYPNMGDEVLLRSGTSKCAYKNRPYWDHASYLGAVFNLRQNDELFVKVTNITMVSRNPRAGYFGLFKIK